jgi:hypothetical protein
MKTSMLILRVVDRHQSFGGTHCLHLQSYESIQRQDPEHQYRHAYGQDTGIWFPARVRVDDDYDHVDGVTLRLWTAAINWPIDHSTGDIWAWRDGGMTSTGKTSDSSTRALWQFYKQSHLVAKQEGLENKIMNLASRSNIFVHTSKDSIKFRKILRHGADGVTAPQWRACWGFLIAHSRVRTRQLWGERKAR